MYIRDLTPLDRGRLAALREQFCLDTVTPVVAVGWLGTWRPHAKGSTSPVFQERLIGFCATPSLLHRGSFGCRQGTCKLRWRSECGAGEVIVAGRAQIFLAPSLIGHYVSQHAYRPPGSFIEAVLEAAGPLRGPEHRAV